MTNYRNDWQASNLEVIQKHIHWLQQQPDGIIFQQKISRNNYIYINKINSLILMLLSDQETLITNVAQSILDLDNPLKLIFPYAQVVLLALAWKSQPKNIYIVGFGGGTIPRFFHHYFPDTTIECTDIDSTVVEVAQKFFGIQLDDRLKVTIQDGREYLEAQTQGVKYDFIITDAGFGSGYMPYRLVTQEFYKLCKSRLSSAGVAVIHLFHKPEFNAAVVKTIQSVFAQVYISNLETGNSLVIATNGRYLEENEILFKAEMIQDFYNLGFSLIERSFQLKFVSQLPDGANTSASLPIFMDAEMPGGYLDG